MKKTKKAAKWTGTKQDFVLSMPDALPNQILDAAKAQGLDISIAHIYAIRSKARLKKLRAPWVKDASSAHPKPAARAQRRRRSHAAYHSTKPKKRAPSSAQKEVAPGSSGTGWSESKEKKVWQGLVANAEAQLRNIIIVIGLHRATDILDEITRKAVLEARW